MYFLSSYISTQKYSHKNMLNIAYMKCPQITKEDLYILLQILYKDTSCGVYQ